MRGVIVVTGVDQLPPAGRWQRLVEPLAAELADSGLGHLPDLAGWRHAAAAGEGLDISEVAVDLVNLDYGRELVRRATEAAGIRPRPGALPERWRGYGCADYFASALAGRGYWDEAGQYWYVWPADRVYEDVPLQFLVIGGPGVDGIRWGYRDGQTGLWAYPLDGQFAWLAPTADELLQAWRSGRLAV